MMNNFSKKGLLAFSATNAILFCCLFCISSEAIADNIVYDFNVSYSNIYEKGPNAGDEFSDIHINAKAQFANVTSYSDFSDQEHGYEDTWMLLNLSGSTLVGGPYPTSHDFSELSRLYLTTSYTVDNYRDDEIHIDRRAQIIFVDKSPRNDAPFYQLGNVQIVSNLSEAQYNNLRQMLLDEEPLSFINQFLSMNPLITQFYTYRYDNLSDGWSAWWTGTQSSFSFTPLSQSNTLPVANAGSDVKGYVREKICIVGSGTDVDDDELTYTWTSTSGAASVIIDNEDAGKACINSDIPGEYVLELTVFDGTDYSQPDYVTVTIKTHEEEAITFIEKAWSDIAQVAISSFSKKNDGSTLQNKLAETLELIKSGDIKEAYDKLTNDLIKKFNGCAISGKPDKNDWIEDCAEQDQVYQLIMEAVDSLAPLVEGKELKNAINNYEGQPELFFNSLNIQTLASNVSLVLGDIPMFKIGGNIVDAMSVIEFMIIGDYSSATSSTASIVMAKMIPFIGQLTTAATTGKFLAEKFDSMLTNQAYGAVVDLLVSQNIEKHSKQTFTEVEMLEFLQSGVKRYGSGGFAIYEINNMVNAGYLDVTVSSAEKTYSLTVKGALAIYASLVPPVKEYIIYGSPTYKGVEQNNDLLNDLQKALTPSSEW